ncbi:hypothetical protein KSP39_PZI011523 [Platanthera zijinensis]|uniref:Uncharacterized protein n=1 Tax=Platanthera zijinensis TaxID=2320716 RepID=A0AAP0BGW2_9ASPA
MAIMAEAFTATDGASPSTRRTSPSRSFLLPPAITTEASPPIDGTTRSSRCPHPPGGIFLSRKSVGYFPPDGSVANEVEEDNFISLNQGYKKTEQTVQLLLSSSSRVQICHHMQSFILHFST